MDLTSLTALYPVAADMIRRTPQLQKWLENRAKKEDPVFFLQLQSLEAISELKETVSGFKEGISGLKEGISELKEGISGLKDGFLSAKGLYPEHRDHERYAVES